ncbi:MAG: hypothetical protein P1U58_20140 [Verrucomicrobiales bacterium]|nr:hypothetical protein [Verrucomicrobiales bacterium]
MRLNTKPNPNPSEKAFTLSEVAMSVGIVAAVLLPILGLLATGSRLATTSQDHAAASAIANAVSGSLRFEGKQNPRPVVILGESEQILDTAGSSPVFASFSGSGEFLEFVEEATYQSGVTAGSDALHLAAITLEPTTMPAGSIFRSHPLLQLKIEVASPALAAESTRSKTIFHSRVGAP